jgi:coniferyl-aldehyde dehydrogenase
MRLSGVKSWIEPHPLGVVGVVAPWNFPLTLAVQPAIAALAAGNRVMIKMSELTPHTAEAFKDAVAQQAAGDVITVFTGGADVAAEFCSLPWNHLFFTGSPATGKLVQRAAAENLVPVSLELGGKNPTVIGVDADLKLAARRIVAARMTNGGQLCLCPDYVFVPRSSLSGFVSIAKDELRKSFPTVIDNPDYCTIVNEGNYRRVSGLVDDARAKGAQVIEVTGPGEVFPVPAGRRIPPTLLTDVTDDMRVMQEEIFGPVLAILPYDHIDDVIDYVNARPLPLAAYWYGGDSDGFRRFKARTRSGGLTRNDFALHMFVDGAPFGGVGNSGFGYYHGQFGFDTFSHLRGIAVAPTFFAPMSFVSPPFSPRIVQLLRRFAEFERRGADRRIAARKKRNRGGR